MDNWLNNNRNKPIPYQLLCFNCSLNTDVSRQQLLKKARLEWNDFCTLIDYIPSLESYVISSYIEGKLQIHVTDSKCYNKWQNFKFVLSPRGAGIDCHRTWEVLAVGRIPIVLSSAIDELYEDLPIVVVKSWDGINKEFLQKQYDIYLQKVKNNNYNMKKLSLEYWTNVIEQKLQTYI